MNFPEYWKVAESETGYDPWSPGSIEKLTLSGKDNA